MNINNVKGSEGYSRNLVTSGLNSPKNNSKQLLEHGDKIDISESARNISAVRGIGFCLDKGTAANTTLYVDKSTFNQIATYTTYNTDCKWDELGNDGEKRWVVINGQRFECPLSKEEKELRRKLAEGCNLISVLTKAEKENEIYKKKIQEHNSVKLTFGENSKFNAEGLENCVTNEKIENLMKNEKVMDILSHIVKTNEDKAITFALSSNS